MRPRLIRPVVLALALVGCVPLGIAPDMGEPADPCDEAALLFESCGASLAFLYPERCAGASAVIAECVLDHGRTCDDLATLDVEDCVVQQTERDGYDEPLAVDFVTVVPPVEEPPETGPEDTDLACADGVDNDGDGYFDCDDLDCREGAGVTVCGESTDALCADDLDNDEDGLVDCADPSCAGRTAPCPGGTDARS